MSNVYGFSSSSSCGRRGGRGRIVGVPKKCWCGSSILGLVSKSDQNPYRHYFRCGFAASQKLMNDDHTFKWVDEALLNEIEALQFKNERLEKEISEIKAEREEIEKIVFDKVLVSVDKKILEKVEAGSVESSGSKKKILILAVIGCVVMFGFGQVVG